MSPFLAFVATACRPEQSALQYYYDQTPDGKAHISVIPQQVFNSYPQTPDDVGSNSTAGFYNGHGGGPKCGHHYMPGDFVIHFAASRKDNANEYLVAWNLPGLLSAEPSDKKLKGWISKLRGFQLNRKSSQDVAQSKNRH